LAVQIDREARRLQREADAALVAAAESQVHVLLTEGEHHSKGQLSYNVCKWLAEQIRRRQ